MPKGKRKGKSGAGGYTKPRGPEISTSDEDSVNDNASVASWTSETRSVLEEGASEEVDEQTQEEIFEEKLREAIDGASQKSAQGRISCLEAIATAFTKKYIPEFVLNRKLTLTDVIERSLKKGRGAEQAAAAHLAPLLCLQLGMDDEAEQVFRDLRPTLLCIVCDASALPVAKSKCCWALALCSFMLCDELEEMSLMPILESVFAPSYPKGNGNAPNLSPEVLVLHSAAISAWSLILTLLRPSEVYHRSSSANSELVRLPELLDSSDVDVRIAAGEAIAVIFELGHDHDADFSQEATPELCDKLRKLATDSHKYRAKKDRKQQRSSFRDILHTVEEGESPVVQVKFGQELLMLDSWCRKKQYDAFCQILGSGMNLHLTKNELVRGIFELGAPLPVNRVISHATKMERHMMNAAAFKARSIARGKNRDKRSAVLAC